ncbi:hypothetical protein PLICRDRAFT_172671 [Plicaturopsis crispa FD-325 SS-3]|nr:hypothetical protein PLICRDRAFT_172671 [Plicaturopsis crispa FD-325 SS-3]
MTPVSLRSVLIPSSRKQKHAPLAPMAALPGDILLEIASYLDSRAEMSDLTLTCSRIMASVVPLLYASVVVSGGEQASATLGMLARRPDVARHVTRLAVRTCKDQKRCFGQCDGYVASAAVRQAARHMDALNTFMWDGEEAPPYDDMWFALRMSCPQLKSIATTLGACTLDANSHMLDFVGLRSFSLTLKRGFYIDHVGFPSHEEFPASTKLWEMLINRCPNLEELCIEGTYVLSANAHELTRGRWPKLRKLTLGDVLVDWHTPAPTEKRPFIDFLETHSSLQSLSISRHVLPHTHMPMLDPEALPNLTHFGGTLEQLQALPRLHSSIKSIGFREPMLMREITPLTVSGLLQSLSSLTELSIAFALHSMYDSSSLLRSLTSSCPQLRHLELTCGHKPSFQLESFAKTIRRFPKLRSLALTIVKYPGDESLSTGAAHIARANPRLRTFTITLIPPSFPLPLPFSPWALRLCVPPVHATGTYVLACDHHGLPTQLTAHEQRVWLYGLARSSGRFVRDLRPGHAARPGWGELLMERSPAGEEVRMILFACLLVGMAVWGFMATGGRVNLAELEGVGV